MYSDLVRTRWKENAGTVPREETASRIAELTGHAMTHCRLQGNSHARDNLLTALMEVYREMGSVLSYLADSSRPMQLAAK